MNYVDFQTKTLEELKEMRKKFDLTKIPLSKADDQIFGYLIKMVDILLEKVEKLKNE